MESISKDWLYSELRRPLSERRISALFDCRSSNEFADGHVRQAVNFSIPTIMLRRLAAGKIDLLSTIRCPSVKKRLIKLTSHSSPDSQDPPSSQTEEKTLFLLYDSGSLSEPVTVLAKRLLMGGCDVLYLKDGFSEFQSMYPEWCESLDDCLSTSDPDLPLMGLRSLRISNCTPGRCLRGREKCVCDVPCFPGETGGAVAPLGKSKKTSIIGQLVEDDALVEILPHLFLGNAANSEDLETLTKHNIKYILNVTPNLPNVFESSGDIKYIKIPITDHWSQNLAAYFPKAIEFIDEARNKEKGVLVHCVAGVSRSVTVTLAYLMARHRLSMNDAFIWVRDKKPNIAPNLHFMDELARFERELFGDSGTHIKSSSSSGNSSAVSSASSSTRTGTIDSSSTSSSSSSTFLSPLALGQSPDSGIEFDRWTPNPAEE